eukprot:363563-Chlamydomonas_euryale.AAC.13
MAAAMATEATRSATQLQRSGCVNCCSSCSRAGASRRGGGQAATIPGAAQQATRGLGRYGPGGGESGGRRGGNWTVTIPGAARRVKGGHAAGAGPTGRQWSWKGGGPMRQVQGQQSSNRAGRGAQEWGSIGGEFFLGSRCCWDVCDSLS